MALTIDLAGRVALVTGGTRGIGRGIARRLVDAGATVGVCGRTLPDDLHPAMTFWNADVRDPDSVAATVRAVVDRFGSLDVLVNNAGGSPAADAASASPGFARAVVDLNLLAPLTCAQHANAVMQGQRDGGVIINVGSVSGERPSPGTAAYGAAKAGLASLTATLAVEWAPRVRVAGVVVGLADSGGGAGHYGGADGMARVAGTVPLGRLATPRDVGDACAFLASPLASYVSGTMLELHGGGERPAFLAAAQGG